MKMIPLILCACLLSVAGAIAQDQQSINKRKLSPYLSEALDFLNKKEEKTFFVVVTENVNFRQLLINKNFAGKIVGEYPNSNLFIIRTSWQIIDSLILPSAMVQFVDVVRVPKEEAAITALDLSTNKINFIHAEFPSINGHGLVFSLKEHRPDSTDIDFKGRYLSTSISSPNITSHGTNMATIIGGAGNSFYTGKGVAPGSMISSSNFALLLPDADAAYQQYNISVQNHSYGTGIENYYGADAAAFDASTRSNPSLIHVFSAGNSGNEASNTGPYAGIRNYANITGSFKMAKNTITVGAADSFYTIAPQSSKGPGYDGRVKPELVAFGVDGTSGAAAIVSGISLLMQQAFREIRGELPESSLIKAILLNSADDVNEKGIDFQSGYGSVNGSKALQLVRNQQYFENAIQQGAIQTFQLQIPSSIKQLKITLCWNDVPGTPNAPIALVNDLDLRLISQLSGQAWLPSVLNSYPNSDSLRLLPVRKRDSLNNTEQITVDTPAAGIYTIEVKGFSIPSASQKYFISYQLDTANRFQWYYPTTSDNLLSGQNNVVRWQSSFIDSVGELEFSTDSGNTWKVISTQVDLSKSYCRWLAPDTLSTSMLRMSINTQKFVSDTFTISSVLSTSVGFNCPDSFLLYWNRGKNISPYIVYHLGEKYLEPTTIVNDTTLILSKKINTSLHYSVAPLLGQGKSGEKSYTFNYTTQGIGCYFKNFLVDLINSNTTNLLLELGTLYQLRNIVVEKLGRNGFVVFHTIGSPNSLDYNFTDAQLTQGANTYRIKLTLNSGAVVYSKAETIYYLPNVNYLIFPNPVGKENRIQVVSTDPENATLILINNLGQKIMEKKLNETVESIDVRNVKKGIYFVLIIKQGNKDYQGSIIIQ